ncbi:MAG: PLP-dependent aminotransferase family protein [Pleurocapsa sp.]
MLHIQLDRSANHPPYYLQIVQQIRDRILEGDLPAQISLTPSRQLALELNISRQTVVNAYEELCAQGYCSSKVGSGTVVLDIGRVKAIAPSQNDRKLPQWLAWDVSETSDRKILPSLQQPMISFESGLAQTDGLPLKAMEKAFREVIRTAGTSFAEYKRNNGHPGLLEAICRLVLPNRGIQATPEQLFITNGSLHSSFLLAELLSPYAKTISYGVPGYLSIPRKFTNKGIAGLPCTVDLAGINLTQDARQASLHYVMPEHHFPEGVTLSPERRADLLQLAQQNDALILEDDYDSEFYCNRHPLPALKAIDSDRRVIYLGTFSKILFNGLRVGYIVAHPTIVQKLLDLRWQIEGGTSIITQLWLTELLDSGVVERHLRRMRVSHRKKRNLIANYLQEYFPDWQWRLPAGGLHFWIQLPPEQKATEVIQQFQQRGIELFSGAEYCQDRDSQKYLVLGFGAVTEADIHQGFARVMD